MTRIEAVEQMELGKRVSHRYFLPEEYITMEFGKIVTEEGYRFDQSEFWLDRIGNNWDDEWELWEEPKP